MKAIGFFACLFLGMFCVFPYFLRGGYDMMNESHLAVGALGCTAFVAAGMLLQAAMNRGVR